MADTATDNTNPFSGFFWGNDPKVNSQLRQRIALQMMATKRAYPKNIGEGLSAVGDSIGEIGTAKRLEAADLAQQGIQPPAAAAAAPVAAMPTSVSNANAMMPPDAQPDAVAPQPSWRDAIAAQMMPTAQGVPPANPMPAGPDAAPSSVSQPSPAQPLGGQPPDQRVAMATPADTGVTTDIQSAPPLPTGIRQAPQPVQVAQAGPPQPGAIPGYVPPKPADPAGAPVIGMTPREIELNQWLAANQGNPYAPMKVAPELSALQAARTQRQNEANELFKAKVQQQTATEATRQQALVDQAKRIQDWTKGNQDIIQQPAPQPGVDPRLGTAASPQRSGIPTVPPVPAGITQNQWSEAQKPLMAQAITAVEKATPQFNEAVQLLQQARSHPGRQWGLGALGPYAQSIGGTDAYAFGLIMKQIAGKNFLNAYQSLKGGGSITEIEGTKAQEALARLSTAQKPEDFDKALNDLETSLRQDLEVTQRKVNRPVTAWRAPSDNQTYAPDVGQRRGNLQYNGGNPSDPMSWSPAQ